MSIVRVLIADDHQIFIDGIKALFHKIKNIKIVAEANNGIDIIRILEKKPIDVVLIDINMPLMDGIETTQQISSRFPLVKVLALSMHGEKSYIIKMLQAGASGYILKNTTKEEIVEAINEVYNGGKYYSEEVTDQVMEGLTEEKSIQEKIDIHKLLTDREIEVLKLITQELTSKEIAEKLFISKLTVDSYRKDLIFKLSVKNIAGLVKFAVKNLDL